MTAALLSPPHAQLDTDSDHSTSGRRHAPATVSKMSFTSSTPASKKRALQKLTQSLTFSDQSVRDYYGTCMQLMEVIFLLPKFVMG